MQAQATFGAGCFWGVEAAFRRLDGVISTEVGFAGGTVPNPSYALVCNHGTGHAEVVCVTFDPDRVTYEQLLAVFWAEHDPTQVTCEGQDIAEQYRSVIFVHGETQRAAAEASRASIQAMLPRPVVTVIESAPTFWPAEEYHQRYLEKRGLAVSKVALAS